VAQCQLRGSGGRVVPELQAKWFQMVWAVAQSIPRTTVSAPKGTQASVSESVLAAIKVA